MRLRPAPLAFMLALLLLAAGLARRAGADDPTLAKVRQAADAVLQVLEAGDATELGRLAGQDDPDPWQVADELFARARLDAAKSFARAAPRPDVEGLPAYLDTLDGTTDDADLRARLRSAGDANSEQRHTDGEGRVARR